VLRNRTLQVDISFTALSVDRWCTTQTGATAGVWCAYQVLYCLFIVFSIVVSFFWLAMLIRPTTDRYTVWPDFYLSYQHQWPHTACNHLLSNSQHRCPYSCHSLEGTYMNPLHLSENLIS